MNQNSDLIFIEISVLRTGQRDWQCRGRPSAQQYTHAGLSNQEDSPSGESPAISLPTPPPPPLTAPPPPPPPRRSLRRNVTFAESPPKSPKPRNQKLNVATLDVAIPWTPASPGHWIRYASRPEYIA